MKFCCGNFQGRYNAKNGMGINIRVVQFASDFLKGNTIHNYKNGNDFCINTKRNDIRFFMTMGYEKFSFDLAMANISFCPFCGTNLHDFYNKDEYANEIEGETFKL